MVGPGDCERDNSKIGVMTVQLDDAPAAFVAPVVQVATFVAVIGKVETTARISAGRRGNG
jgi:hypothetical protein